jgi:NAD(P)-dependent dehydrogenase (short-subunit alcohol dehydrogenase family)
MTDPTFPDPTFPDLRGASVFVTGGGSGIGAALTEGFLRQGARVAFVGRSDYSAFAEEMERATGCRPLALRADITDTGALRAAIDEAAAAHGPVTRLVNNAADDRRHGTLEVDEAFYRWSTDINLKCYFFACQHVIRRLGEAGEGGAIVNLSSISYMMGNGGYPLYTAANGAITALTRSLARDHGAAGIRVNALAPGWVLTPKQLDLWATPEDLAAHLARQCLKEHLRPADMVAPALFLASAASRMMTGQCMAVDGGVVTVAA